MSCVFNIDSKNIFKEFITSQKRDWNFNTLLMVKELNGENENYECTSQAPFDVRDI